jgi:hypothetical protein
MFCIYYHWNTILRYMENVENPPGNSGKTGKPGKRVRIAHCVGCTNEWTARNGNEEKPSRCPVCGSRNVKWRDECTQGELMKPGNSVENVEKPFSNVELPPENMENDTVNYGKPGFPVENRTYEDRPPKPAVIPVLTPDKSSGKTPAGKTTLKEIQENFTGIPVYPLIWIMGILGAVGLVFFLIRQRKTRHRKDQEPATTEPEPIRYESRAAAMMRQKLGSY